VEYFDALHTSDVICIRMQLVGRNTLYKMQRRCGNRFPLEAVWNYGGQVACAIAYCHATGIAHRDIKHENVVGEEREGGESTGVVRLVDFGQAIETKSAYRERPCGTLPFAAPEVLEAQEPNSIWNPDGDPDPCAADVWSHGIMVLEMAAGLGEVFSLLGWNNKIKAIAKRGAELRAAFGPGGRGTRFADLVPDTPPPGGNPLVSGRPELLALLGSMLQLPAPARPTAAAVRDAMEACARAVGP